MLNKKEKKILIENLPENWRTEASSHFSKSVSFIEKVAYGSTQNIPVFEYLVAMAEENHQNQVSKMAELKDRLQKLAKPAIL